MAGKECPLCGETMKIRESTVTDRIPGTPQSRTASVREWVCPECDYYEEVEEREK